MPLETIRTPIQDEKNARPYSHEYPICTLVIKEDKVTSYKIKVRISHQASITHPEKTHYLHSAYVSVTYDIYEYGRDVGGGCGDAETYAKILANHPSKDLILNIARWHLWDFHKGAMHHLENGWYWYNMAFNESCEWYKAEEQEKSERIWENYYNFGILPDDANISFRKFGGHPEWGFIDKRNFIKNAIARWELLRPIMCQDVINVAGGLENLRIATGQIFPLLEVEK